MLTDNEKVIFLREITKDILEKDTYLLYIHTPFCGTCHIARSFLHQIETAIEREIFYKMNASFFPEFMEQEKIRSVPCLYIKVDGQVKEKVYTFHSVANIVHYLLQYVPDIFQKK